MIINNKSKNKELKNSILALGSAAAKAKRLDNSVINATSGMLKSEDGSLYEFSCVKEVIKELSVPEKFAYSNSAGTSAYAEAILYSLFGRYLDDIKKNCFIDSVATPGGSGGLTLAFTNYVNRGETVLFPNHMWENYLNFADENEFNVDTYRLFNDDGLFDIDDLNAKVNGLKTKQKRIMILVNDPCENPTGFCMKDEDYDSLLDIAKNNPNTDFVYLMDVAYFDFYNGNPDIIRSRYAKFKNLPNNALALFVYSGSKSFGLYGLRIGALVGLSKDQEEIVSFKNASVYSTRSKWSVVTTLGMSIIEKLVLNEKYRQSYEEEVKHVYMMLENRSLTFLKAAKEVGLKTLPYERGFFICVPYKNPEKLMHALHEDKVHLTCTSSSVRIALCAINKEEAKRLPAIIKKRLETLE